MSVLALLLAAAVVASPSSLHDFAMKGIEGKDVSRSKFKDE